jgi:hypothetical protein
VLPFASSNWLNCLPDVALCFKHIGIYAYRSGFIKQYLTMNSSDYEQVEKLEQLSVLNEGLDRPPKSLPNLACGQTTLPESPYLLLSLVRFSYHQ